MSIIMYGSKYYPLSFSFYLYCIELRTPWEKSKSENDGKNDRHRKKNGMNFLRYSY